MVELSKLLIVAYTYWFVKFLHIRNKMTVIAFYERLKWSDFISNPGNGMSMTNFLSLA